MKKTRKLLALVLCLALAAVFAVPGFAAEGETTYTITAPDNGHTYEVYQIFTGDYYEGVLSNIKWGKNGTGTAGEAVPSDVISALTAVKEGSDTEKLAVIEQYVNLGGEAFGTVTSDKALTVPGGYYLIKDSDGSLDEEEGEAYTLYIVQVVDNVTITPKADVPKVEKKVKETNDSTGVTSDWQDGADYDIGDTISFQLTGTVANNYDDYETYKFVFHDKESAGLTFQEVTSVKVGDEVIQTGYRVEKSTGDGCTFEVIFDDLKDIESVEAGSVITVEYTSVLNENAVFGGLGSGGNTNTVHLEFSNNPNDEGTGNTPEDTVTVFTFKLDVDKVDGDKEALKGAGFTLYKYDAKTSGYVPVGSEIKGEDLTKFVWEGLDSGKYKLVESTVPNGYNKADDLEFEIVATYTTDGETQEVINLVVKDSEGEQISGDDLTFTTAASSGIVATDVVNTSGLELPETGGMGTTLFYIVGAVLVIGAAVLLVTRRRVNAQDK